MRFSTRLVLASLLGFAGFSTDVDAHAKLVYPAAWNANPSKTVTCGVAQNANANPAMFKRTENILAGAGQTVDVKWTVVVGDGTGPITAKIDTTAKVNPTAADFTVNLAATADFPNRQPAVGPFTVRFTLPASLKCTGPGNTCTMRVASSSNWVACATIQLKDQLPQVAAQPPAPVVTQPPPTTTRPPTTTTQPPTTPSATTPNPGTITQTPPVVTDAPTDPPAVATDPPTPTPTTSTPTRDPKEYYPYPSALNNCQIAANLKTCTNINGQSVQLMGVSLEAIEQQAIEQIDFDMLNPAVLERPNTVGCRQALTDLICAQMFPPCQSDNQVVCTSTCQRVTNLCRPNTTMIIDETGSMSSHAQLFDCTNTKLGFTAIDQDTAGACPNVGTGERTPTTTTTTTPPFGTTQKPVNIGSTGRNQASSLTSSSSATVVMGVVTLLLAFVARV